VRYGERWAARFHSFFRLFKLIAAGLSALLFLSSAFIISNQVRLAVALRRERIELLRMLGAGTTYLAAPYLLEGVLLGLAGSGAALAAVFGLYRLTLAQAPAEVAAVIAGTSFLPPEAMWVFLLAGASAGLLGSLVSLRRLL
jgi:cell division transport system permease protein